MHKPTTNIVTPTSYSAWTKGSLTELPVTADCCNMHTATGGTFKTCANPSLTLTLLYTHILPFWTMFVSHRTLWHDKCSVLQICLTAKRTMISKWLVAALTWSSLVSLESRKGTWVEFGSARALMHIPSAVSDRLMLLASLALSPAAFGSRVSL